MLISEAQCNNKKNFYPLPFMDEVINTIVGHEVYTFLDGFSGYH
jgi:hypothetical protein